MTADFLGKLYRLCFKFIVIRFLILCHRFFSCSRIDYDYISKSLRIGCQLYLYTINDFGKLCLKPYESLLLPLYIDEDTAQGYSYTSSIDSDVYNRIKLAWDNDETGVREVHVMNNTASQSKWGTLQYYEKLDNALNTADLQTKAKALMKYYNVIHRELTMQKVFGDVRARAGTSVCVGMGLGDINIKNYMCVEKAKHTFSNGLYTMDLYLSGIRGEFSA